MAGLPSSGEARLERCAAERARSSAPDRRALVCLLLLGAVLAGGLVLVLANRAPRRSGTNGVGHEAFLPVLEPGARACQRGELLPAGTSAVRLFATSEQTPGPRLAIELRRHGRLLQRTVGATGARDLAVIAPIRSLGRDLANVTLCFTVGAQGGRIAAVGGYVPPGTGKAAIDGTPIEQAMAVDYLSGVESGWSFRSTIARRIGMGRGDWGRPYLAWLAAACVLAAIVLALRTIVRTVLVDATPGRLAASARAVAAIAVLNALAWSFVTPVFQVPDEEAHVAYVQQVAEHGRPGVDRRGGGFSAELTVVMLESRFGWLGAPRKVPALWSPLQQRRLAFVQHAGLSPRGEGDVATDAPEPPLFYALAALPYRAAHGATLLDRLTAIRVLTALMAGATAFLVLLFVRTCLPGHPWTWTVAGLVAAFTPLLGFISGGVHPDALLFPVAAALFACLARAWRRGLTMRGAVAIGLVLGVGAITKINFYGVVPGALLALALVARASAGAWNARAARLIAVAVAVGLAPYVLLSALDALLWDRAFVLAHTPSVMQPVHGLGAQLSYLWQLYFPRLPGQAPAFPELSPPYDLWVTGFLGRFGWVTVAYPEWGYRVGAAALATIALLALRALVAGRTALRGRALELVGYASMAAGLLLLIGMVAVRGWAPGIESAVQGRYVLPLLPLFGGALALAARGAGDRWGRTVGVAFVMLAIAWSVAGQLLTVAYYFS